jgi:hypothetical protein
LGVIELEELSFLGKVPLRQSLARSEIRQGASLMFLYVRLALTTCELDELERRPPEHVAPAPEVFLAQVLTPRNALLLLRAEIRFDCSFDLAPALIHHLN